MTERIIYGATGKRYFLGDQEVSEAEYQARTQARDRARLDEMLRASAPPQVRSDATFLRGHCNGSQFATQHVIGDRYKAVAEEAGQNVTGKVYMSQLANYPGDPEAWVSGRGDVKRVLEKRGWGSEGAVSTKVRESLNPPAPGPAVADDIVAAEVSTILETVPPKDRKRVDVQDLKEQVIEKRKPHWKK